MMRVDAATREGGRALVHVTWETAAFVTSTAEPVSAGRRSTSPRAYGMGNRPEPSLALMCVFHAFVLCS